MSSYAISRRTFVAAAAAAAVAVVTPARPVASAEPNANPTIAARQRFFGAEHVDPRTGGVDPDKVILSWFGVTSFAMAIAGDVFLLDAWVPRGEFSNRVPTSPTELAALAPSHIFIGHGHFDHAADAAEIASLSGATIVGTEEHCRELDEQAATDLRTHPLSLDRTEFTLGGVTVRAVRHLHSGLRAPRGEQAPLVLAPDFTPTVEHPPTLEDLQHLADHAGDEEGGSLLYQFEVGGFVLTWHDSSGPLVTDAPQVLDTLRQLPASSVQIGSIQGYNQYTNGLGDTLDYIRALRPSVFVPSHHDNWLPPVSAPAAAYEPRLREAVASLPNSPEVRMLVDPTDYLRPSLLTFDLTTR